MEMEELHKYPRRWEYRKHTPSPDPERRNDSHTPLEARMSLRKEGKKEGTFDPPKKNNPFSAIILDIKIMWSLEKFTKLQDYNGTRDTEEYIEHIDGRLDYYHAGRDIKCIVFAQTLIESSLLVQTPSWKEHRFVAWVMWNWWPTSLLEKDNQ